MTDFPKTPTELRLEQAEENVRHQAENTRQLSLRCTQLTADIAILQNENKWLKQIIENLSLGIRNGAA